MGDELDNLGRVWTDGHGAGMAGDNRDVKDLFNRAINAEPFGACPFGQINDLDPTPRLAVGVFQLLIQRQPFKAFAARLGQADIGKAVAYGETAGKAGAEHRLSIPLAHAQAWNKITMFEFAHCHVRFLTQLVMQRRRTSA